MDGCVWACVCACVLKHVCEHVIGWIYSTYKDFPWPHLVENWHFLLFFWILTIMILWECITSSVCVWVCAYVCLDLMLQDWCCLIRTSLPAHPSYPHNPLAGETACFISLFCCCQTLLQRSYCLGTQASQPLLNFEIMLHVETHQPLCVNAC